MNLTSRQKQIFDFIKSRIDRTGISPTVKEICEHFKLQSLATVHKHLKALEKRGWIRKAKNLARSIEIASSNPGVADIPLLGLIAAGRPIEALEVPETIAIPEDMLGHRETFCLQVNGDSMIEDGIHSGDYIIVEKRDRVRNGEIVVASIENTDATVKRFYKEGTRVRLQPSNRTMKPLFVAADKITVKGVVIGLIRKYRNL